MFLVIYNHHNEIPNKRQETPTKTWHDQFVKRSLCLTCINLYLIYNFNLNTIYPCHTYFSYEFLYEYLVNVKGIAKIPWLEN